jgi:hypothetical protein
MQLGFNLINGVTDTRKSSSILINFETHAWVYIHGKVARCHID